MSSTGIITVAPSNFVATPESQEALYDIHLAKYLFLVAFIVAVYDHACTLPEEIETVWKKKQKTFFLYLFIFVRYYTPIALSVGAFVFFSTWMNYERCLHWMYFMPLGVTLALRILLGILMAIRVYALWNKNTLILSGLLVYLTTQTAIYVWLNLLPGGTPLRVPLQNYEFQYCVYSAPLLKNGLRSSSIYIFMDLGYDTIVFSLTISRTIYMSRKIHGYGGRNISLMRNLARDGALYFGGICAINLTWVLMIVLGSPGVRALIAMPTSSLTVVLISRITLNLHTMVYGPAHVDERTVDGIPLATLGPPNRRRPTHIKSIDSNASAFLNAEY